MKQVLVAAWIGVALGWVGFGWVMGEASAGGDVAAIAGHVAS